MKRYEDVLALVKESKKQYIGVKELYDKSLKDKSLDIRIKVKNLMENMRSTLDYTAHDVYDDICKHYRQKSGKLDLFNIYFPYGKNEIDFKSSIGRSLPNLAILSPLTCPPKTGPDIMLECGPRKGGTDQMVFFDIIIYRFWK